MTVATRPSRSTASLVDPFAVVLKGLNEEQFTALLVRRSDLATPAPRRVAELIARAGRSDSISRAVDYLDQFTLMVVQAAMALDGAGQVQQILELLGPPADEAAVVEAVHFAEGLLLLAAADGAVVPHPFLRNVIWAPRLGPSLETALEALTVDELRWVARYRLTSFTGKKKHDLVAALCAALSDPDSITATMRSGPADAIQLVRRMASEGRAVRYEGYSVYPSYAPARGASVGSPVEWLAWNGLIIRNDWNSLAVPREVAFVLNKGRLFDKAISDRPGLVAETPLGPDADAGAIAAGVTAVEDVDALVGALAAAPAKLLKQGGVGVREVRRLAKAAELNEERAAVLLEVAAVAGLVGEGGGDELLPTNAYDAWSASTIGEQWVVLATSWLAGERFPSAAGRKAADDRAIPTLQHWAPAASAVRQRAVVLSRLAQLPEGAAPSRSALSAAAIWDAPLAFADGPGDADDHVAWVLDEAAALGLVHLDAISKLGRHLASGDVLGGRALLDAHASTGPTNLILQADLTAIVPSGVSRSLRDRLTLLAEVESKGAALVLRFSEASLRRGFDAGLSAADILGLLEEHAELGVPQPLAYLVGDVARRYGAIRVGGVRSYLRCADEVTATEVLRERKVQKLGLRAIAPTVLVSAQPPDALLEALRGAGFLPAQEDGSGALVVRQRAERRASSWTWRPSSLAVSPDERVQAATTVARQLLAGGIDAADEPRAVTPRSTSTAARPGFPSTFSGLMRLFDEMDFDETDFEEDLTPAQIAAAIAFGADECERPSDIVQSAGEIEALLLHAEAHAWTVRVGVGRAGGEAYSFDADVEAIEGELVELWCWEQDDQRQVRISDIAWARVLTEAEEDRLIDDPPERAR